MSERQPIDLNDLQRVGVLVRIQLDDNWLADMIEIAAAEIARFREERRSISTLLQNVETLEADNERLREQRRWVPVGERLPENQEWVDVAGLWGDSVGWHEPSGWRNVEDDDFWSPVTHWRKRGPGPEANG